MDFWPEGYSAALSLVPSVPGGLSDEEALDRGFNRIAFKRFPSLMTPEDALAAALEE